MLRIVTRFADGGEIGRIANTECHWKCCTSLPVLFLVMGIAYAKSLCALDYGFSLFSNGFVAIYRYVAILFSSMALDLEVFFVNEVQSDFIGVIGLFK